MNKEQRINWVDMAKGYGMLLVIFGHMGDFGKYDFIIQWVFSFHIPLFFFLSGFCFKIADKFKTFFMKKVYSIIIPYFCLGLIMVLFLIFEDWRKGRFELSHELNYFLELVIQRRFLTIWFLPVLLFVNLLFFFAVKYLKKNKYLAVLSGLCLIFGWFLSNYLYGICKACPWNIDAVFMAFPFFFGGYYLKQKSEIFEPYLRKTSVTVVALLVSLILNVSLCYCNYLITGLRFDMYDFHYGFIPVSYPAAFAGIGFIIIISRIINLKLISYIGKNSMLYLAWHQTIIMPIVEKGLQLIRSKLHISLDSIPLLLHYVVIEIFVVLLLTLINELICRTKLRVIVGKRNK